jgi:hypothetical protein
MSITGSDAVTIRNSRFSQCSANVESGKGGAIFVLQSKVTLFAVHFDNCRGSRGGSLFAQESQIEVSGSTLENSTAPFHGGAIYAFLGTTLDLRDSTVKTFVF